MMDNIFIVQTTKGWLIIYMDDMLILAEMMEELTVCTIEVLQLLHENDLYLRPQKCEFGVTKVNFLGFIIEHGKMMIDPVKLAGIADWPEPSTLRQLRSFLGFGNFYRKFIHYSDLTHPPGELETYNALRAHYWWPGMCTFVKNYVKGCAFCQQFKINRHPTKPALMPIPGPTSTCPFAQISMDFITDLPPV